MNEGGFDLVTASGDASLRLIAGKRVQPINIDLIPSWATVDERLKDAPWHTVDGVHYGVPYMWGPNVLMYNTEVFKEGRRPRGTWCSRNMTLPDGKSNKGRVQAYDGPIHIADAAQYLMFHKPELGITSPYELNEDQYKAALDLLRGQRKLVSRYWHDAFIQMDDFKNEGVVASGSWPFQVNLLKADKLPVPRPSRRKAPRAGPTPRCCMSMPPTRTAPIMWMEHSLSSNLQSDLVGLVRREPRGSGRLHRRRGMQTAEGCTANGLDDFDKIRFWTTPVAELPQGEGTCVPYYRWVSDYIGVIGGR